MKRKNPAAVALGKLGRAPNTEAQKEAARLNGAKGGRPPGHRCPCGATGRDVRAHKGYETVHYECKKCGRTGLLRDIEI